MDADDATKWKFAMLVEFDGACLRLLSSSYNIYFLRQKWNQVFYF